MHYSRTAILSILIFLVSNIQGQEIEKDYRELKNVSEYQLVLNNDSIEPFYISTNPITNREYLTYLCWVSEVYQAFPEIFLNAFPNLNKNHIDSLLKKGFTPIQIRTLVESNNFIKNYMFTLKYLDYPVLGLTWSQSMNFLNWLSDRYNEYFLIRTGIQDIYWDQFCENSFNTESHLMDQYEGLINRGVWDPISKQPRNVKWKDRILIPSFRLPSYNELTITQKSINNVLKEYQPNKFINHWTKHYIEIKKHEIVLRIERDNYLLFSYNKGVIRRPEYHEILGEISEITLDQMFGRKENSILKIFSDIDQNVVEIQNYDDTIMKDSLGHMPFIIISEDENSNPILIERVDYPREKTEQGKNENTYSIFRYALCGIKK